MDAATLAGARAGRRRFRFTVIAFAVANLAAWFAYHHFYGPGGQRILRVDSFSPGDRAMVDARPVLEWQFNLDVAPDPAGGAPGIIQPGIPGTWHWRGRRNLIFQPLQDLPKATPFTVTIPAERLRTAEGFRLPGPFVANIGTAPLRVVGVRQGGFEDDRRYVLEIEFDDAVIPADVASKLAIKGPDDKPLGFKLHGEGVGKIVRVLTDSVGATEPAAGATVNIAVRLDRGLAGVAGPLGLDQAFEQNLLLGSTLTATGVTASADGRGRAAVALQFNGGVDLALLRTVVSVEPPVPFVINSNYRGATLEGDFKPGNRYAVKIAAAPKGADARLYPRADVLSVFVPDRSPMAWFEHDAGYLGAQGNRTLLAHAVNLPAVRVRVWRVYDGNLVEWRNSGGRSRWQGDPRAYAKPIASRNVPLKTDHNVVQDVRILLDDYVPAGSSADGVFRVSISAVSGRGTGGDEIEDERDGQNESASSVVTLSDIALTAKSEARGLTVWATSLSTAQTLERVRVRVFSNKNQLLGEGLTGADGLVTIAGLHPAEGETAAVLLADRISAPATRPSEDSSGLEEGEKLQERRPPVLKNEGLTWMDLRGAGWDMADTDVAGRAYARGGQEAFVYTDRGVYRPGETVHLRAIVRRGDGGAQQVMPLRWLIRRPDLREWKQQVTTVDADGSASLDLALPDDLTTGRWTAQIGLPGEATAVSTFGSRTFLVEEFMPNRLKVGLGFAGKGIDASRQRATIGEEPLRAVVQADYLFGRPAAGLQTKLTARLDPSGFQPADWGDWTFGDSARVLDSGNVNGPGAVDVAKAEDSLDLSTHALNATGHGEWPLQLRRLLKLPPATRPATTQSNQAARYMGPWQLAVEASVQEVGGRSVSAADSIQVDALPWYIGVHRQSNGPALPGSPSIFEVSLVAPSGKIAAQEETLEVSLFRESWNNLMTFREGRYRYESHRVLEPVSDAAPREVRVRAGRGKIAVTPPSSGAYVLRIYDGRRGGMTTVQFYASNGGGWEDNVSREHPEKVEVIVLPPDDTAGATTRPATVQGRVPRSPKLKIGQTARVLIRSPFAGRLLFTVETDRVISTRVIEMSGSSVEVPLEVSESLRPNAYVSASVIRAIDPQAKWRTHRAHGTTRLTVDPADRRLAIEIVTPPEVRPLSTLDLGLRVTDAAGQPIPNAPVTVAAVDEGILQLTSFHMPDPLGFFYADRALAVASSDSFGQLMPEVARPEKVSAVGGDKGAGGTPRYRSPVTARRVRSVALFTVVRTDDQGFASTHLSIPEFAGQLRIMAVAHAGAQYGATDRPLFVRAPLLVQSSFPRFAAPGDRFVAPITLFNNGKVAMNVTLSAELLGTAEARPLAFAATPEAKLAFETVSIKAGEQHVFGLPCVAADRVGVARVRLMASAGVESCTETTELPIRPPSPFISSGGFAVVSPGAGEPLDLKNEFLAGTEQTSVTLTPMPSLQLPQAIDYLERYPYGCAEQTVSTSFALLYLDEIGRSVAPGVFEKQRVADKVQTGILRLLGMQTADGGLAMWPGSRESWPWASIYAAHFLVEARAAGHAVPEDFQKRLLGYVRGLLDRAGDGGELLESQAYASYVLALSGKPDRAFMSRLGELTRTRADGAEESAIRAQARLHLSLAWLAAGRRDLASEYLPSSLPGVRLKRQGGGNVGSPVRDRAMILNTLLTVRPEDPAIPALAGQLAEAKWQSTQEIAFAAMAIGKYLRQAKTYEPYDRAELLLDGIPMAAGTGAVAWNVQPLQQHFLARIAGPPAARGYLAWTRSGVPLVIPPNEDHGIKVRRRYLDEHGKPLQSNKVQSGDLVLVELTVEASAAQRNLVIEDLLPAGLEIENSRLETTASLAAGNAKRSSKDVRDELREARLDVRDDRMILFGHLAENGLARHVYAARAVVPGIFVVPPVRVECMYDPGTSSLWGPGGTLEVKRAEIRTIVGVPGGD